MFNHNLNYFRHLNVKMIRFPVRLSLKSINTNSKVLFSTSQCVFTKKGSSSSSSSSSSEDEGKQKSGAQNKSKEAKQKLNVLLQQMVDDKVTQSKKSNLDLAKPKPKRDVRNEEGTQMIKTENVEQKVVKAVKDVAQTIGGNVKQTESELLSKLLNISKEGEAQQPKEQLSLSEIIKDMKVDKEQKPLESVTRADQVKKILKHVREGKGDKGAPKGRSIRTSRRSESAQTPVKHEKIDLWGASPLGIFSKETTTESESIENTTWNDLYKRDLRLAVTHPPSNYFQEMIHLTEQGKLWKFPIDNEQDLETEKDVYFAEHIFLEKHLESWCPSKGPVRHFMELVCVGLSKNSYLTVEKKKDHIKWYQNYFEEKKTLLKEVGAIPVESKETKPKPAKTT